MILINVLVMVALASTVVMMMIALEETAVQRSRRFNEAAQALAYAEGGETSAIVALRRDAMEAPRTDNLQEAWARLAESEAQIENGTFSLSIEDAQARFNINNIATGGSLAGSTMRKLLTAFGLPPDSAKPIVAGISAYIKIVGPVPNLDRLRDAGVDATMVRRLDGLVTALPGNTTVNINTASEELIGILLGNPVAARSLIAQRARKGFLTSDDVAAARILLPPDIGFTSNYFRVVVDVTVGDTAQRLTSLLNRRRRGEGPEVVAISRKRGTAAPLAAPP